MTDMRGNRHGEWLKFLPRMEGITNINQYLKNEQDLEDERRYRIEERLGIMCGTGMRTDEQLAIAIAEADEWVLEYIKSLP